MLRRELTALDRIGVALVIALVLALCDLPLHIAPAFRATFRDLGGPLPKVTSAVVSSWCAPALASMPLGLALGAVLPPRMRLDVRRWLIVGAFAVAAAAVAFCLYGLYAPIFELAGNIRAE